MKGVWALLILLTSFLQTNEADSHLPFLKRTRGPTATDQIFSYCSNTNNSVAELSTFIEWPFSNSVLLQVFPTDSENRNFVRKVHNAIFSVTLPTPFSSPPKLAAIADEVLEDILDLNICECASNEHFIQFLGGSWRHPKVVHLSHRYGGHQFGHWAGQLGDGRAVLLGEYTNRKGERWELQLKGSGKTPYSRNGDGRAVLRSSVREFLASEAMHHLGVPTSRAASLAVSEDRVWRDQFYDGHPTQEKTAVVLRLAPSWFRIGSIEILHYSKEYMLLRQLVDFVIEQYFPLVSTGPMRYSEFFASVVNMTASLIAQWQAIGFAHGVCNTDNFSLLSLTIDYGPFGFLDSYDPDFVPNTSDDEGRYSYRNQPHIGIFNMQKLLVAMGSLLGEYQELAEAGLRSYPTVFNDVYLGLMRMKLGLHRQDENDESLIVQLLDMMEDTQADYTQTFREISEVSAASLLSNNLPEGCWTLPKLQRHPGWMRWVEQYIARLQGRHPIASYSEGLRLEAMQAINPCYVLRNHMAESAIQLAERGDFSEVHKLYGVLKRPFDRQSEAERAGYSKPPPPWATYLRVSCSS